MVWQRSEGTLSIHTITTGRRECFYWAAVLATFAMATAAGDLAAYTVGSGFLSAGLFFACLFPAAGDWLPVLPPERDPRLLDGPPTPLGRPALVRRLARQSRHAGGLGFGDGPVAFALTALIVAFVAYLSVTGTDDPTRAPTGPQLRPAGRAGGGLEPSLGEESSL